VENTKHYEINIGENLGFCVFFALLFGAAAIIIPGLMHENSAVCHYHINIAGNPEINMAGNYYIHIPTNATAPDFLRGYFGSARTLNSQDLQITSMDAHLGNASIVIEGDVYCRDLEQAMATKAGR
jgi:hypothetical protein